MNKRCEWVTDDPIYIEYHDHEWGRPVHDDQKLFEMLSLEGAQAGLSWITILKRRENYRKAFDNFDPEKVAHFDSDRIHKLIQNKNIIRNRRKIESVITNAMAFLNIQREFGSFDHYIWQFVGGEPILNDWADHAVVPSSTEESEQMSKDLKKRGFKFVGPTICYAFMQATGMVNDHTRDCFLYHGGWDAGSDPLSHFFIDKDLNITPSL
ncbi:DNA-3-methyladenine glycosylase I [Lentibacillus sp.]|uniref:DNA-3-methyladenine glycosylase I n=1 Tax=Lentibacillus sp. TaxID=1925746 RepID=UPI002B4B1472|nr:DNA-3-methyladenine glycosylase I [Lentibacillus sp.]HLS09062.1 DNA-3-methyladenine glycosylase I [Lentibacillus sp.]